MSDELRDAMRAARRSLERGMAADAAELARALSKLYQAVQNAQRLEVKKWPRAVRRPLRVTEIVLWVLFAAMAVAAFAVLMWAATR
jgi:hypothetical protein